ncbi:MAG TPA: PEP-CTERM sorting domain-containing protein [Burkholderiaceae bacterium]|nr:PEP-CTERM sorting domain-containing protein [Burkholderiaceae bacterium]HRZ01902.1 PEP-CTERM sorting domain-containing protein [Burkholderiaceae bacterium]
MKKMKFALAAMTVALAPALWQTAQAQAVIQNADGSVKLGVDTLGDLGVSGIGITRTGVGDGITPGCLCEGWGLSGNGIAGWVGNDNGGTSNVTGISFSSTASTATASARLTSLAALAITQSYAVSASNDLFVNTVTITNGGAGTITNVRYSRSMDWDIPPTTFDEYVTIQRGGSTALKFSNDNGFATPNPLVNPGASCGGAATVNTDFVDNGPCDHGAFFTFGFGDLAAGESLTFNIYYGASVSEAAAFAALGAVGAEVYSLGQNSRTGTTTGIPATFVFAFSGVGGTPVPPGTVPEPGSLALLTLAGLGVVGFARRRQRA